VVIGVGIDLQEISEFHRTLERAGEPYIQRVFTVAEIAYCRAKPDPPSSFAVRFAAKEATIKALGIAGIDGLNWHDFDIRWRRRSPCLREARHLTCHFSHSFEVHCRSDRDRRNTMFSP
jgi:phosphopantetheine--protein transferase-like protein